METWRVAISATSLVGLFLAVSGCSPSPENCGGACPDGFVCESGECVQQDGGGEGEDAGGGGDQDGGGDGGSVELAMEAGPFATTDTASEAVWEEVEFSQTYDEAPLVFATPSSEGGKGDPAAFRIRNVSSDSFEIVPRESPEQNGTHDSIESYYFAVESGETELPDGTRIATGTRMTDQLVSHEDDSWNEISLPDGFDDPIVLAQLQTTENENNSTPDAPSEPWLTAAVRNVTGDSFELALEGSECTTGNPSSAEVVGWVAVESGAQGTISGDDGDGVSYETIRTGADVTGWDDGGATVEFEGTYDSTPGVVGQKQSRNSNDGGWLRLADSAAGEVNVRVDEDQCNDSERENSGEVAGLLVFSGGFRL